MTVVEEALTFGSEQTDRVIARNFVDVLNGASKYATYY